jgi:hypothetical protein
LAEPSETGLSVVPEHLLSHPPESAEFAIANRKDSYDGGSMHLGNVGSASTRLHDTISPEGCHLQKRLTSKCI